MDLFTIEKQRVIHKATGIVILAIRDLWINGVQHVDCLVPQVDEKNRWYFANATYSVNEIQLI
jgi:hypothetical protein